MTITANERLSLNVEGHVLNSTAPHAARIGDYVVSSSVNGRDVLDGDDVVELRPQVSAAFDKMAEVLSTAGAGYDDLALLVINVAPGAEVRAAVLEEWRRRFPGAQGPVTQLLVPRGGFPKPNTFLGIQLIAKCGGGRQVTTGDSDFPDAVRIDDLVVIAPVTATDQDGAAEAFAELSSRCERIGINLADIGQLRVYGRTAQVLEQIGEHYASTFGTDVQARPALTGLVSPDALHAIEVGPAVGCTSGPHVGRGDVAGLAPEVAVRGELFFTSAFAGPTGPSDLSGSTDTDSGTAAQLEGLYRRLESLAITGGGERGLDRLVKVSMWIDDKDAKTAALVGWRELFGSKEDGARDKTPARTFLIHAQPDVDPDVVVKMELMGVRPTSS